MSLLFISLCGVIGLISACLEWFCGYCLLWICLAFRVLVVYCGYLFLVFSCFMDLVLVVFAFDLLWFAFVVDLWLCLVLPAALYFR